MVQDYPVCCILYEYEDLLKLKIFVGLTMFLADSGIQNLTIVGPHGLHHYLASMRTFLWRFVRTMSCHVSLCFIY